MPWRRTIRTLALVLLLAFCGEWAFAGPITLRHYDEVYDEQGNPRPQYVQILLALARLTREKWEEVRVATTQDLQGDNSVTPILRVLSQQEYETVLEPGVAQRAKALLALAQDYYSGRKTYLQNPKLMTDEVLIRIMERYGEAHLSLNPDSLAMHYGPDLLRDERGVWRVLEDSTGQLGQEADLGANRETLARHWPEAASLIAGLSGGASQDPMDVYRQRVAYFKSHLLSSLSSDDVPVLIVKNHEGDHEHLRLRKIYEDLGMTVLSPGEIEKRITVRGDQAYVKVREGGQWVLRRIGFLSLNSEHKFLKIPALLKLIDQGKIPTDNSRGTEFLNDKELYMYVEEAIRHYLHEEPILRNLPTRRLTVSDRSRELDAKRLAEIEAQPAEEVLKDVNNRGGKGVWVGRKAVPAAFAVGVARARETPSEVIDQGYAPMPLIGDRIGDLRINALVSIANPALVSPVPAGRVSGVNGDGKVNLTGGGGEAQVVLVSPAAAPPALTTPGTPLSIESGADTARLFRAAFERGDPFFVPWRLERLLSSAMGGVPELIAHLSGTGMLGELARRGIGVPNPRGEAPLLAEPLPYSELRLLPGLLGLDAPARAAFVRLNSAQLFAAGPERPPAPTREEIRERFALAPGDPEARVEVLRAALRAGFKPGSASEWLATMEPMAGEGGRYTPAESAFVRDHFQDFFALHPTLTEFYRLRRRASAADWYEELSAQAVENAASAGLVLKILTAQAGEEVKGPSELDSSEGLAQLALARVFQAELPRFEALGPSPEDWRQASGKFKGAAVGLRLSIIKMRCLLKLGFGLPR